MSRLPQPTSSTATLIETGRRVCRLCDREGNGASKYAERITKAITAVQSIADKRLPKTFERIASYDALVLADTHLDDAVRSTFYTCRKYDWNAEGAPVLNKVFPDGVFSPIVHAPRVRELELVARMITCLRSIAPDSGPLTDAATELEDALKQTTEAQELFEKSVLEESKCKALENLGKKEYVEEYGAIYHKACGDLGRTRANRLFPAVNQKKRKVPKDRDDTVESMSTAA